MRWSERAFQLEQTFQLEQERIAKRFVLNRIGARGGSRTPMRKNPRRILSPQRLPFRHPGAVEMAGIKIPNFQEFDQFLATKRANFQASRNIPHDYVHTPIMLLFKKNMTETRENK